MTLHLKMVILVSKCTVEQEGCRVTIELEGVGHTFEDLYEVIKQACMGVGFREGTVEEWFGEEEVQDDESETTD